MSRLEALELLNNELVLDWSRSLAGRCGTMQGYARSAGGSRMAIVYARAATPTSTKTRSHFSTPERYAGRAHVAGRPRKAALTDLCHMLVNSNEFLYIN